MLRHVVFQMAAKVHFEEVTKVCNVVSSSRAHLRQPSVQLVQPIDSNHVVDVAEFL